MKKLLVTLGIICLCVVMVIIVVSIVGASYGPKLDKSSKAYVDEVVPIVLSSWNPQELERRALPEFLKSLPSGEPAILFKRLSESLGVYEKYKGAEGESHINFSFDPGGFKIGINATYVVRAAFQKGDAEIKVDLNQGQDGKWRITGFFVRLLTVAT